MESTRKSSFEFYYDQAYSDIRLIVRSTREEDKNRYLQKFELDLHKMELSGESETKIAREKSYLYRRLYYQCMEAAKKRYERGEGLPRDLDQVIKTDPDIQIAGSVFNRGHFKSANRWGDDIESLRASLQEAASRASGALFLNGLSQTFLEGHPVRGWGNIERSIGYFFQGLF